MAYLDILVGNDTWSRVANLALLVSLVRSRISVRVLTY
jgi:hypothetical protein